jgi:hypothetical protein
MAEQKFNAIEGFSVGVIATTIADSNANISANALSANGNVSFTGSSISLGPVANISITGGNANQYLSTDGTGNLSWDTPSGGGSPVIISNTAPVDPSPGDLWWDSEIGVLFIYYDDGDSSQWVESTPQILVEGPIGVYTLTGDFVVTGDTTIQGTLFETSDIKLKKDVETIHDPLDIVNDLRGVNFSWVKNDKRSMGMIAQEVEQILPYLVQDDPTGTKTINYTAMIGLLVESIKELNKKIDALENKKTIWQKIRGMIK